MTELIKADESLYLVVEEMGDSGRQITRGFVRASYPREALDRAAAYYRWRNQLVTHKEDHLLVGLNQTRHITVIKTDELPKDIKELSWASR